MRDYSDIEWIWVENVVRTDERHIEVIRNQFVTTYEFDTDAKCLEDFLYLRREWREYFGKKWENKS
jgi:hypothetical protein